MTTGKTIVLTVRIFVSKVMSLLFNTPSMFVIAFLSRCKCLKSHFMAAVIICSDFGAQENKICHCFHFFLSCFPWSDGTQCHDLSVLMLSFKPAFSLSSFILIRKALQTTREIWEARDPSPTPTSNSRQNHDGAKGWSTQGWWVSSGTREPHTST